MIEDRLDKYSQKESKLEWLWMISYSDLMTNLMLFFLMSYCITRLGPEYYQAAAKELQDKVEGKKEAASKIDVNKIKTQENIDIQNNASRIVIGEKGVFDLGDAELKPEAVNTLHNIALSLKKVPYNIVVEGHTDNLPVKPGAKYESNWELSAARAENVVKYLVHSEDIAPERIAIAAFGEYRPVADNSTEEGRSKNRRIEIVILRK